MSFLRTLLSKGHARSRIEGAKVFLRFPVLADHGPWATLRRDSRGFLTPWEPLWAEDDLSRSAFRHRIDRYDDDHRHDHGYHYLVFRNADHALVGGLNLTNIRRGVAQSASLGYWAGHDFAGRGLMSDAVRTLLPHAFTTLKLRRIEAGCLPANIRSIALLEAVGFQREGYARQYLKINGVFEDHVLYAFLKGDVIRRGKS